MCLRSVLAQTLVAVANAPVSALLPSAVAWLLVLQRCVGATLDLLIIMIALIIILQMSNKQPPLKKKEASLIHTFLILRSIRLVPLTTLCYPPHSNVDERERQHRL